MSLREVDWWYEVLDKDVPEINWHSCDLCDQSYLHDVCAEPQRDIRQFYRDDVEGLIVCEKCKVEYEQGEG